jgi:glutamate synthase domain-containing protein 2
MPSVPSGILEGAMKPEDLAKSVAKAQELANSPAAQLARKVAASPSTQAAQQLAQSPTVQLARKVAESQPATQAAKQASSLADELQAIRRRLATPEGSKAALDAAKAARAGGTDTLARTVMPWARTARRRGVAPPPQPVMPIVSPPLRKIDTDGLIRRAKEIFDEDADAKRELDRQMVATMEKMHAALVEANQRESEALDRATAAEKREAAAQTRTEKRETLMIRVAVGSMAFGALSFVAAVVAIFVAVNAS